MRLNRPLSIVAALLAILLSAASAWAIDPEERLTDPALEAKARAITKQLRCVVCDNASVDDSDAQVAKDMRKLVRKRLVEGRTEAEIKQEFVGYYGDYVLLQPRFSLLNLAVWLAAPLALLFGVLWIRRRTKPVDPASENATSPKVSETPAAPLSEEERKRLDELLKD